MVSRDIHQMRDAEPDKSISNNRDLQPEDTALFAENKVLWAVYPNKDSCMFGNPFEQGITSTTVVRRSPCPAVSPEGSLSPQMASSTKWFCKATQNSM